jgi:hypothetical protein
VTTEGERLVLVLLAAFVVAVGSLTWVSVLAGRPSRRRKIGRRSIDELEAEIYRALSDPLLVRQARRRLSERRRHGGEERGR